MPKNIVAFIGVAAALHDYGVEVKGVFGPTKAADGKADVQAGDLDIDKVEVLGNVWGEFNVEKYAGLAPELLVTAMWEKDALWYVPDQSKDKILKLAPSVALWAAQTTMPKAIQRHEDLAASLGADVKAEKVTDAKAAFEKAAARLRAAAKSQPNIKVKKKKKKKKKKKQESTRRPRSRRPPPDCAPPPSPSRTSRSSSDRPVRTSSTSRSPRRPPTPCTSRSSA